MSMLRKLKEMVLSEPKRIVLKSDDESFSFEEIDKYSDYVSFTLEENSKLNIVPIYINNDIYVLPVVLGVIKAGKIPLPLVTALDIEKSLSRVSDIKFDVVLTDSFDVSEGDKNFKLVSLPNKEEALLMDGQCIYSESLRDEIYIICTSGTTGVPKKVFLTEKNLIWLLDTFYSLVDFSSYSVFLFSTPYTFDVSLTEIFAPIFTGGTLYCLNKKISEFGNVKNFQKTLRENKITHLSLSPSYAELLYETAGLECYEGLECLCLAGEVFPLSLGEKLNPLIEEGCRVFNLYGPSEATVYTTWYELSGTEKEVIPIGVPLSGANVLVLDDKKMVSKRGELYISGKGLSKGYMLDDKLNFEKFPVMDGIRYYKTGDYVYYDENGMLVFECRMDEQVQINGTRIELSEISSIVSRIAGVDVARVVYYGKKLYVFYKSLQDLDGEIISNIPRYLSPIPVKVNDFILNSSRKLDVAAMLEKFYFNRIDSDIRDTHDIEDRVKKLLKKYSVVGASDLDSLDTVRFYLDIEEEFGIIFENNEVVKYKTIEEIANYIKNVSNLHTQPNLEKGVIANERLEIDELNLRWLMKKSASVLDLDGVSIDTLYHQKKYDTRKFKALLYFNLEIGGVDYVNVSNLDSVIKRLSEKIDIFRMILIKSNSKKTLCFGKLKKDKFSPVIYVCEDFLPDDFVTKILYDGYEHLLYLILISKTEKQARFYFTHHILDGSSMNILEGIFYRSLRDDGYIDTLPESSYENFIEYTKNSTKKLSYDIVANLIPETESNLNMLKREDVLVAKFPLSENKSDEITINSVYWICQCIFSDYCVSKVTGTMITNMRNFCEFDATHIIGDIHSTIPFEIYRDYDISMFREKMSEMFALYRKGINLLDAIYDGYPEFCEPYGALKAKWLERNIAFNYIGEVKDVYEMIYDLKHLSFAEYNLTAFSHREIIYVVGTGDIFKQKKYAFSNNSEELKVVVEIF